MEVWRLTRQVHREYALDGRGARLAGGRWNSKGTAIGYTSSSLELAVLENLVHLNIDEVPEDLLWLKYEVPNRAIQRLDPLPEGWGVPGRYQMQVQTAGDLWVRRSSSLALAVPSTVLPLRQNILINPAHSQFSSVKLLDEGEFTWPARLLTYLRD